MKNSFSKGVESKKRLFDDQEWIINFSNTKFKEPKEGKKPKWRDS